MPYYHLITTAILITGLAGITSGTATWSTEGVSNVSLSPDDQTTPFEGGLQCVYYNHTFCNLTRRSYHCTESVEFCPSDGGPPHCYASWTTTQSGDEIMMKGCHTDGWDEFCMSAENGRCIPQQDGERKFCCCSGANFCNNVTANATIKVTVGNGSADVCKEQHSCQAIGCGPAMNAACKCDSLCPFFNDCCYDYEEICSDEDEVSSFGLREGGNYTCVGNSLMQQGYWLVTSCPGSFQNEEVLNKCQISDPDSVLAHVPVSDNMGIPYRNVHCAVCNGIDATAVKAWEVQAMCNPSSIQHVIRNETTSPEEKLAMIAQKCPLKIDSQSFPIQIPKPRSCFSDLIGMCTSTDLQRIFGAGCSSYTAVVNVGNTSYKNPHCFLCNHDLSRAPEINCRREQEIPHYEKQNGPSVYGGGPERILPIGPRIVPISVLMDFGSDKLRLMRKETVLQEETMTCPEGQVYNPTLALCQHLVCPDGYRLVNRRCKKDAETIPSESDLKCAEATDFQLIFQMEMNDYQAVDCSSKAKMVELVQCVQNTTQEAVKGEWSRLNKSDYVRCLDENTEKTFKLLEAVFCIKNDFHKHFLLLHSLDSRTLNDMIRTCSLNILQVAQHAKYNCSGQTTQRKSFLVNTRNYSSPLQDHNLSNQHIDEYKFGSGIITEYKLNKSSGTVHKMTTLEYCSENASVSWTCPLVALSRSLFKQVDNVSETLQYLPTGDVYEKADYMYQKDGTVLVCLTLDYTYTQLSNVTFFLYSNTQVILSTAGTSLSVVACAVTLLTYTVFPVLRKRSGSKSIMNLIVALLIAQLLLLVNGQATNIPWLCAVVSATAHYFWLAAFCWMNVLSLDLCYTFGSIAKLQRSVSDKTIFLLYMMYAWGLPIIVIVPCIAVHICECTSLQYGNEYVCWIVDSATVQEGSGYSNLLAFGLPIALLILINIVLYGLTVAGIRQTKSTTARMQMTVSEASKTKRTLKELFIYIKIGSLMGFSWAFSFAAAFSHTESLWYVAIVLNSLQGVFIFMSFTMNSRVWNLWRRNLVGEKRQKSGITKKKEMQSSDAAVTQSTSLLNATKEEAHRTVKQTKKHMQTPM
ncbi:uncharacterized protein LOC110986195 [Acanthaster planci]|uniref:Uncharacterized protein LOC110986195 n=1 Tax=Acanthaster planci TaxID=133434 RepID=A0A8B7ZJU6_ACAPL|nr:uncharacterized protein LOC110986195 [Acanthaster planci]